VRARLAAAITVSAALAVAAPALAGPPQVDARAFVVENGATGEVLAESASRERLAIASITKLMTVLVTLQHARLGGVVTIPPEVTTVGESTIFLRAGERISVRDLIEAALIPSANDAADALAYHGGHGDQEAFVRMMNAQARRLGLSDTHYVRPDGLDAPGHVSSARDVTRLARILMRRPVIRSIVRRTSAQIAGGRTIVTRNDLLYTFPGLIGVKTGHTSLAGWSEVAAARRNGVTVYATILGSPSEAQRNADLSALLSWGLSQYRLVRLAAPHRVYGRVATGYGKGSVPVEAARRLVRAVRVRRPLVERIVLSTGADLPVHRGDRLGAVNVFQRGRLVGAVPLVAAKSVSSPGFAGRIGWYVGRTFHHLFGWI
jgi:D-alanyl-D-alanine carboxypeptidase (penicillin-binding protein 5/6)